MAARKNLKGLSRWVTFASAGFGACLMLFAASRIFWLSLLLLVPMGFAMMVGMAATNTLIQSMVPDRLRGRVMAVYSMTFIGMAPFGALLAGMMAKILGAPLTLAISGVGCIAGAIVFGNRYAGLRSEARELIVAQQRAHELRQN